jgi:hypothetical protein
MYATVDREDLLAWWEAALGVSHMVLGFKACRSAVGPAAFTQARSSNMGASDARFGTYWGHIDNLAYAPGMRKTPISGAF